MLEAKLQIVECLSEMEETEVYQEAFSMSIIKETNIDFLFIRQEIQYLEYLIKTLGYNYKYYLPSHFD